MISQQKRQATPAPHNSSEWTSAKAIEHVVKVCVECNGVLARDVEDPARPVVAPLLRQARRSMNLTPGSQLVLAR